MWLDVGGTRFRIEEDTQVRRAGHLKRGVTGEGPGKPIWLKIGRGGSQVADKPAGSSARNDCGLDVPHDAEAVVELLEGNYSVETDSERFAVAEEVSVPFGCASEV